jgi:hypothetical protein
MQKKEKRKTKKKTIKGNMLIGFLKKLTVQSKMEYTPPTNSENKSFLICKSEEKLSTSTMVDALHDGY